MKAINLSCFTDKDCGEIVQWRKQELRGFKDERRILSNGLCHVGSFLCTRGRGRRRFKFGVRLH